MLKARCRPPQFAMMCSMKIANVRLYKIALLAIILLASGCANFSSWAQPPTVSLSNIELLNAESGNSSLKIRLSVSNPNPVALPVQGLQYQLQLNGHRVLEGVSSDIGSIPAFGSTDVELETRADLVGMFSLISSLMTGSAREVDYQLETHISVEGLWRPIRLQTAGSLPLSVSR